MYDRVKIGTKSGKHGRSSPLPSMNETYRKNCWPIRPQMSSEQRQPRNIAGEDRGRCPLPRLPSLPLSLALDIKQPYTTRWCNNTMLPRQWWAVGVLLRMVNKTTVFCLCLCGASWSLLCIVLHPWLNNRVHALLSVVYLSCYTCLLAAIYKYIYKYDIIGNVDIPPTKLNMYFHTLEHVNYSYILLYSFVTFLYFVFNLT